jgi:pyruvate dehydrogenase E2 component (dihydrolipoamide acetyltransferase)
MPALNGYWIDGGFRPARGVHVGLAIALKGGGLVAPALHDTERKSLDELMTALHELIPRARIGRLRSSEMTDATATLTNLGDLGVESVHGVIYPPQVALIGFGKIARRPWVEGDTVCVRPLLTATLAADHRATDGRYGARFLESLDRRLQTPEQL